MPHSALLKRLRFSYFSAVIVIALLITCSQIIIQLTLYQETETRGLATLMSRQELHSQRFLRNSILVFSGPQNIQINPLHVDARTQLQADLTFLETTNQQLLDTLPVDVANQLIAIQSDFHLMDDAGHQLLNSEQKGDTKSAGEQVTIIFTHEQNYLSGTYTAYTTLTQQADGEVTRVQWIELAIWFTSILVLNYEVWFVVLPAIKDFNAALLQLENVVEAK